MVDKLNTGYTADSIKVLKGLEAVRKRPGMYIGNTDEISGLHHMLYEVLDNAIDEALAGYCKNIIVKLHTDGSASVEDDGRGIPVDIHKEEGISAAEVIMTQLHAGGKFSQDVYKVSGGLHGVGVSVVNALSSHLTLKVWQNKKEYEMCFSKGLTQTPLTEVGTTKKRGTYIRFLPDNEIFSKTTFDYKLLCVRFQELAFLNPGISIVAIDERSDSPVETRFHDTGGVESFAKSLCKNKTILNSTPLIVRGQNHQIEVDCSIFWTNSYSEQSLFFTNTIPQIDGGTHAIGLRAGLTKALQNHVRDKGTKNQQKIEFTGDDIREGMVCILSIKVPDPKFSSQTKEKLVSSQVRQVVEAITTKEVESWLEENPNDSSKVINRILESANAREAARRARDLSRKNKASNELNFQVAKKLAGCSEKDPSKCQLFIVEGDSAGGSAKQARDRFFQAVLPLRGKILNIEKVNFAKALTSEMIATLVAAIGTGIGDEFNLAKLRYHKIVIMTDADVDGKHIAALLLTFFYRYMRPLIEAGHIHLAKPPLYGIVGKKSTEYIKDDRDFIKYILDRGASDSLITDSNGNQLINKEDLLLYLNDIQEVKNSNLDRIYQWGLAAKSFDQSIDDQTALERLNAYLSSNKKGSWRIKGDSVSHQHHGVDILYKFDRSTLPAQIRKQLEDITANWSKFWGNNSFLKGEAISNPVEFFDQVMDRGRQGLNIQRFKGLGEMNPRELGVTTMQEYMQVQLGTELTEEIIQEASEVCSRLMGDNVAERRKFIEENARFADVDL
jgi:DNA gyrase subunit B